LRGGVRVIIRILMADATVHGGLRALIAMILILGAAGFPALTFAQGGTAQTAQAAPERRTDLTSATAFAVVALNKQKAKHVAVFDFVNPDGSDWDPIGRQLAADFRTRLDDGPQKFQQISYENTSKWMKRDSLQPGDVLIDDVVAYVLRGQSVDACVLGLMKPSADKSRIDVLIVVYNMKKNTSPTRIAATLPFAPELKAMLPQAPENATPLATPTATAGVKGYTAPSCLYCPQAEYTQAAVDKRLEGVVTMIAVILPNGKAGKITIVKGQPLGLNAAAISAVRKWRFNPADGPDGKPAAVRQTIEVQFHLY
jgi:TonB family protein